MAFRGSFSRSFFAAARSSFRSPPHPRRAPPLSAPRYRSSFAPPRSFGEIGCVQSLLPLCGVVRPSSQLSSASARAFCDLTQGTFCRTCQDR